jgi:mono/diheme cytochrome c family protein
MRRLFLFLLLATAPTALAQSDPAATLFLEQCAACHTVGVANSEGLDLLTATQMPGEELREAVARMEANVGPMTDETVNAFVALLKSPDVVARLKTAATPPVATAIAAEKRGSATRGRALFMGEQPLANHGLACFACHTVDGRGGNLASDLTTIHARRGANAVVSAAETPLFPLMKAAYAKKAVTTAEAVDIATWLEETSAKVPPGTTSRPENLTAIRSTAAGTIFIVLGGAALILRTRRAGTRSRMVRDSSRRHL